jgi:hypothetical protein
MSTRESHYPYQSLLRCHILFFCGMDNISIRYRPFYERDICSM